MKDGTKRGTKVIENVKIPADFNNYKNILAFSCDNLGDKPLIKKENDNENETANDLFISGSLDDLANGITIKMTMNATFAALVIKAFYDFKALTEHLQSIKEVRSN